MRLLALLLFLLLLLLLLLFHGGGALLVLLPIVFVLACSTDRCPQQGWSSAVAAVARR